MAEVEVGEVLTARGLLELLRDAEDYGAYKALLWLGQALRKAKDLEDVRALMAQVEAALNEAITHRWAVSHFLFEPQPARLVPVAIPKDLWLKVREAAKRLGRDPEDLIAEAVRQFKAELEARKRIWLPPDLYAKIEALAKARGKRPEDVVAELLELAKDRLEDLMEPQAT